MDQDRNPSPDVAVDPLWLEDLHRSAPEVPWLWQGYLARRHVTLLTSPWKAGKTTLLSALLARMGAGGELAGQPVCSGRALLVSEESPELWRLRSESFDFGKHVCWICRPFRSCPDLAAWRTLLDRLATLHRDHHFDLLVIDPLSIFLPLRSEAEAGSMTLALQPLRHLAALGLAVLLLHHPRKGGRADSNWARGTGALLAQVDIIMEMDYYAAAASPDRRRRLMAYARFPATPRCQIIQWSDNGTDYPSLGDPDAEELTNGWHAVQIILAQSRHKLTCSDILSAWPPQVPKPSERTLYRWLEDAVARHQLHRSGAGHRHDPYRYWNDQFQQRLDNDPIAQLYAEDEEVRRLLGMK